MANSYGRVIGIITGMLGGAQNMGFAIPVDTAKKILEELRRNGQVICPWIGIRGMIPPMKLLICSHFRWERGSWWKILNREAWPRKPVCAKDISIHH